MPIKKKFIPTLDGTKLLLENAEALRAKSADGSAQDLIKLDSSDVLQFLKLPRVPADPSDANDIVRKSYLESQVSGVQQAVSDQEARIDSAEQEIDNLQQSVGVLNGNSSVAGSVDYKISQSVNSLLNGAPEAFDTLKEIADYISSDQSAASAMTASLNDHESRLDTLEGGSSTVGSVDYKVSSEAQLRSDADSALQGSLSSLSSQVAALVEDQIIDGVSNKAASQNAVFDALALKASQAHLDDLDGYAQDIRDDLDALDPRVGSLEAQILTKASQSDLSALDARVDQAEADILTKASASSVSAIDARLVTAEGEIDSLQSTVAGLASSGSLGALELRVGAAEGEIDQLQSEMLQAKADIDAAQSDIDQLQSEIILKANSSDVSTSLSSKADLVGGKIPQSQIPSIAIVDTFEASSEAAMLALSSAEQGDVCIRSDLNKTFILASGSYDTLANWKELKTPTDAVLSVNGQTGAVSLTKSDVGLGNVDNTSDVNKPLSTAATNALSGKASTSLNNLSSTAVNTSLIPSSDGVTNLGSTTYAWNNIYANGVVARTKANTLNVGGSASISSQVTFSVGSADITCATAPGVSPNRIVYFTVSSGAMPGGLNANTRYFVKTITAAVMQVSSVPSGSAITVTSAATGTVSAWFPQQTSIDSGSYGIVNIAPTIGQMVSIGGTSTIVAISGSGLNISTPVNMQNSITPDSSGVRDLGTSSKVWRENHSRTFWAYDSNNAYKGRVVGDSDGLNVSSSTGSKLKLSADQELQITATSVSVGSAIAMNGNAISGLASPVDASDAATKNFAESKRDEAKSYSDAQLLVEKNRAEQAESALDGRLDTVEALQIPKMQYQSKELVSAEDLVSIDVGAAIIGTPLVMISGVMGRPGVDFTVSGSVITFSGEWLYPTGLSAVELGDVVHVYFMKMAPAFA